MYSSVTSSHSHPPLVRHPLLTLQSMTGQHPALPSSIPGSHDASMIFPKPLPTQVTPHPDIPGPSTAITPSVWPQSNSPGVGVTSYWAPSPSQTQSEPQSHLCWCQSHREPQKVPRCAPQALTVVHNSPAHSSQWAACSAPSRV